MPTPRKKMDEKQKSKILAKLSALSKTTSKTKTLSSKAKTSSVEKKIVPVKIIRKGEKRSAALQSRKTDVDALQQEVERMKYDAGVVTDTEDYAPGLPTDLPAGYHEDKIIVQVRDPWWVHTYWEVKDSTIQSIQHNLGNDFEGAKAVLRVYDVTCILFDGSNAHKYFDIEIPLEARSWYIDIGGAGRSWCIDIGFRLRDGRFILIARSNTVLMPLDGPSWQTDEEWMIPDDLFARLYHLGFGLSPSSPLGKDWTQRFRVPVSSMGLFSMSSPRRAEFGPQGKKDFWLVVNTELIVYGATEPDAKVTVKGHPIKLNPDGTFSLRFALPDGKQVIPVEAWSADGTDSRSVTPVVSKETH